MNKSSLEWRSQKLFAYIVGHSAFDEVVCLIFGLFLSQVLPVCLGASTTHLILDRIKSFWRFIDSNFPFLFTGIDENFDSPMWLFANHGFLLNMQWIIEFSLLNDLLDCFEPEFVCLFFPQSPGSQQDRKRSLEINNKHYAHSFSLKKYMSTLKSMNTI